MSNYKGIFLRSSLGQDNTIPRQGMQNKSPDVLLLGTEPVSDPQAIFGSRYDSEFKQPLSAQQTNYIYLRGKNYADQPIDDTGDNQPRLFWSKASALLFPQSWTELSTCPSSESFALKANPGSVGVTNRPYVWQPQNITGDHYCLIAVAPSPGYDNNIPDAPIRDFNAWVAEHGGIGWAEAPVTNNNGSLIWQGSTNFQMTDEPGEVLFLIVCKNLPVKYRVSFSAGSPGTDPAIHLGSTEVTSSPSFSAGIQSIVPANYVSDVYLSLLKPESGGLPIPVDASIQLQAFLVSPSNEMKVISSFEISF